jgi:hypothetical protein
MRLDIEATFNVAAFAVNIAGVEVLEAVGFEGAARDEKYFPPKNAPTIRRPVR